MLLNQTEIRLNLPFSDCFGTKCIAVWFQNNRNMVKTIGFQLDSIRFRNDFSVSSEHLPPAIPLLKLPQVLTNQPRLANAMIIYFVKNVECKSIIQYLCSGLSMKFFFWNNRKQFFIAITIETYLIAKICIIIFIVECMDIAERYSCGNRPLGHSNIFEFFFHWEFLIRSNKIS